MLDINSITPDKEKAEKGVWCEFEPGVEFLIAQNQNSEMQNATEKTYKDIPAHRRNDPNRTRSANREIMAKTILLGWKGIGEKQADGTMKELAYSKEAAMRLLSTIPSIFEFVFIQSTTLENFQKAVEKEDAETAISFPTVAP